MKSCWRKEDFIVNCTTASSPSHKEAAVIKRETDRQETRGQEKLRILVSACLLGENCKYSGGSNRDETVLMWKTKLEQEEKAEFIPICPEVGRRPSHAQNAGRNQRRESRNPRRQGCDCRI